MSGYLSSEISDEDGQFFEILFQSEEERNTISSTESKANSSGRKKRSKYAPKNMKDAPASYVDYDQVQDFQNGAPDAWISISKEPQVLKDYRTELELYRGNDPESSEEGTKKPKKRGKKKNKKKKKITEKGKKYIERFRKELAHKVVCSHYKMGHCLKGDKCLYSHTLPKKIRALCKFYVNNACRWGEDCKYMHSEFPCKYFHTKSVCLAQNECRFSHELLTKEMAEVLHEHLNPKPQPTGEEDLQRPCLLGNVSDKLAQSEDTRLWREEMSQLKVVNSRFSIEVRPTGEKKESNTEPSGATKLSFYRETLIGLADVGIDSLPFHQSPLQDTHEEDFLQPKGEIKAEEDDDTELKKIALPNNIPSGTQVSVGCFDQENGIRVKMEDYPSGTGVDRLTSPSVDFTEKSPLKSFPKQPSVMPVCPILNRINGFKPPTNFIQSEISKKQTNVSEWKSPFGTGNQSSPFRPPEMEMAPERKPVDGNETASKIPAISSRVISDGTVPPEIPSVPSKIDIEMPLDTGMQGAPYNNLMQNPVNKRSRKRPRKKTPGVQKKQMQSKNQKEPRLENPWLDEDSMVVREWSSMTALLINIDMHILQHSGKYSKGEIKKLMPIYEKKLAGLKKSGL